MKDYRDLIPAKLNREWELEKRLHSKNATKHAVLLLKSKSNQTDRVVLKTIFGESSETHERMRREINTLNKVKHPSILKLIDFELDPIPWHLSKFEQSLVDFWFHLTKKLSSSELLERSYLMITDMLNGLEEVHKLGRCHRDPKPHNVIVDSTGRPVQRQLFFPVGDN